MRKISGLNPKGGVVVRLFLLSAAAISLSLSLVFVGSLVPFGVISFSLVFFMCLLVGLLSSP